MSGVRVIRSHWLVAVTVAMMALFAAGIAVVVATSRTRLVSLDIELPSYYRPGQALAKDPPCEGYYYSGFTTYDGGCIQNQDGHLEYAVQFVTPERLIQRASKWAFDMPITLGDLVDRWGTPRGRRGSLILWDDRGAYVLDYSDLSPESKVYFISYGPVAEEVGPWTGFAKDKSLASTPSFSILNGVIWGNP